MFLTPEEIVTLTGSPQPATQDRILREWGLNVTRNRLNQVILSREALVRTIARGKRTGQWGFDGPALAAVERALEVYEAQLAVVSRVEARDAVREVSRRVQHGHVFEVVREGVA